MNRSIRRTDFHLMTHAVQQFHAVVPNDITPEELVDSRFWSNVRAKLNTFSHINVITEDGENFGLFIVQAMDDISVKVGCVYWESIEGAKETNETKDAEDRYVVKQRGQLGWCVVDLKEDRNVATNLNTKSQAQRALEEHRLAMAK